MKLNRLALPRARYAAAALAAPLFVGLTGFADAAVPTATSRETAEHRASVVRTATTAAELARVVKAAAAATEADLGVDQLVEVSEDLDEVLAAATAPEGAENSAATSTAAVTDQAATESPEPSQPETDPTAPAAPAEDPAAQDPAAQPTDQAAADQAAADQAAADQAAADQAAADQAAVDQAAAELSAADQAAVDQAQADLAAADLAAAEEVVTAPIAPEGLLTPFDATPLSDASKSMAEQAEDAAEALAAQPTDVAEDAQTAALRTTAARLAEITADVSQATVDQIAAEKAAEEQAQAEAEARAAAEAKAAEEARVAAEAQAAAQAAASERAAKAAEAKKYPNGKIPSHLLCSLDFAPAHQLRCDAADALNRLNQAYKAAFGTNISMTDSYRDYDSQVRCRQQKGNICAIPGQSNHGLGQAVDLGGGIQNFGTAQHNWMRAHAEAYGWTHPSWARIDGSKPEAWHWEFVG